MKSQEKEPPELVPENPLRSAQKSNDQIHAQRCLDSFLEIQSALKPAREKVAN